MNITSIIPETYYIIEFDERPGYIYARYSADNWDAAAKDDGSVERLFEPERYEQLYQAWKAHEAVHAKEGGTNEVNKPNTGWICPICGRGVAPFRASCPCVSK